jgi:hypothetical protein
MAELYLLYIVVPVLVFFALLCGVTWLVERRQK